MIKIATAECFTHGIIGREIHKLAQNYTDEFGTNYCENIHSYNDFTKNSNVNQLNLVSSLFIPTVEGVEKILKIEIPPPYKIKNGIKIYKEDEDKKVAFLMANSIKNVVQSDIGIGTTAGIGKGGISIVTEKFTVISSSNEYANLETPNSMQLFKRQESGIIKTLELLFLILTNDMNSIRKISNTSIIRN